MALAAISEAAAELVRVRAEARRAGDSRVTPGGIAWRRRPEND
jgi:hypothetical protein